MEGGCGAFRRRLPREDAIRLAGVLPPVVRAIFVSDWDPAERPRPFADLSTMTGEAQGLLRHDAFASRSAIRDVAASLLRHVDEAAFDRILGRLPERAADLWAVSYPTPVSLTHGRWVQPARRLSGPTWHPSQTRADGIRMLGGRHCPLATASRPSACLAAAAKKGRPGAAAAKQAR
ncbi:DUF2267 domain-containing protein [Xanthobacter sp. V4C-4]|uniref:DUF2267 domain-containing protein n=1 Tax=Xanthobacter cornucopiae TaxID=3119924 RepID=UPI003729D276